LVELVRGDDVLRLEAIRALGLVGEGAGVDARRALAELAGQEEDAEVLEAVAWALGRVGDEAAVPVLGASLKRPEVDVVAAAGVALGLLGRREMALDDGVRRELVTLARHADPMVRYGAVYALARE